jgi:hypothetical protein
MKNSRMIGLLSFVLGIIAFVLNYVQMKDYQTYYPIRLTAGVALFFLGIAIFIFPGAELTEEERGGARWYFSRSKIQFRLNTMFKKAPLLHRTIWIISFLGGLVGGWIFREDLIMLLYQYK